jgi:rubrerythrin
VSAAREPKQLTGAVYRPGAGFHSYPPPKDRAPQRRVCSHCGLPAETNARFCPVCGARYSVTLRARLRRRFGRA